MQLMALIHNMIHTTQKNFCHQHGRVVVPLAGLQAKTHVLFVLQKHPEIVVVTEHRVSRQARQKRLVHCHSLLKCSQILPKKEKIFFAKMSPEFLGS